jgi:phospholipid-binding lipoprotein MlaA
MMQRGLLLLMSICLLTLSVGCATGPNANPADPLEPMNRSIYKFNDAVDGAVLKPISSGYKTVVPSPIRTGVSNFFSNIGDLWSMFNHALQFEMANAGKTAVRFGINTIFGIGGIFDIATDAGITPPKADLGQTLGKWGVPSGPYVVIPILGPSSVRDGAGAITSTYYDPVNNVSNVPARNTAIMIRIIDVRSQLLNATDAVDQIALDKYSFIRDVYLKRRQSMIKPQGQKETPEEDIDYSADDPAKSTPEQSFPKLPPITLPNIIFR